MVLDKLGEGSYGQVLKVASRDGSAPKALKWDRVSTALRLPLIELESLCWHQ